jgi:hypothetical protein
MLRLLKSIKTALVILFLSITVFVAGSIYIPRNLSLFSDINDIPLFRWLSLNYSSIGKTFWIYLAIFLMALLSLNMIFCLIDDILKRLSPGTIVQRLSPHLIHLSVLIVLFGHLMSGLMGFKKDIPVKAGEEFAIESLRIRIDSVEFVEVKGEDQPRWRIGLSIFDRDKIKRAVAEPARPVFYRYGIYAKSAEPDGRVVIGLVDDPGAFWEVVGAVVFVAGSAGLFSTRFRKDMREGNL